jgi:hypothetical protein
VRITNTIFSEPLEEEDQTTGDRTAEDERSSGELSSDEQSSGDRLRASYRNGNGDDEIQDHDLAQSEIEQSEIEQSEIERTPAAPIDARVGDRAVFTKEAVLEPPRRTSSEPRLRTSGQATRARYRARIRRLLEEGKSKKTPRLILQIWQSDYSIIAFVLVIASFYLMKDARYPPIGVLFFLLAMATIDSILSIFVVRLSFHQNKHGFYRTEDFERDWLRYRILLSMTKAALLFLVATTCGTSAVIGSYVVWFFTSTQRLRYFILRWAMDDHYPELQRFSIFTLLREFGIGPKLKNFNVVAVLGVLIGFTIAFVF